MIHNLDSRMRGNDGLCGDNDLHLDAEPFSRTIQHLLFLLRKRLMLQPDIAAPDIEHQLAMTIAAEMFSLYRYFVALQ